MNRDYYIIIDNVGNVYKVKQRAMAQCFDKIIAPLDIISQVGNESEMEIAHEIGWDYVKQLESGLMSALDELSISSGGEFDYYDKLRELTGFGIYQVLDFWDMCRENEGEEV